MPRAQVKDTIQNAKKIKLYKDETWVNLRFVVDIRRVTDVGEKEKDLFQDKFFIRPIWQIIRIPWNRFVWVLWTMRRNSRLVVIQELKD